MWKKNIINSKWVLLYVVCSYIFGASVPEVAAIEVARNVYLENEDLHVGGEFIISTVEIIKEEGNKLIYIFHLDPTGFIMVPADNQAVPNLAFGFDYPFETSNMPSNLQALMNQYKMELSALIKNRAEPSGEIAEKWDYYLNGNVLPNRNRDVNPLINAEFDQGGSWNNGIQAEIGFNGPVGCVSVAMCQIMHYWGYPEHGTGSTYYDEGEYSNNENGNIAVDFEDAFYDFDNISIFIGRMIVFPLIRYI